ncbi:hypothetical protein BHE74_00055622 [Ensete ventricosum]|nr:hypothetical protein BHE74_00055622 [Ensete ventricosum]
MLPHSLPCRHASRHAWRTGGEACACRWGGADLTCARSAVRHLASFVQPVDQSRRVGYVSSPGVRGRDDLTARSASVISNSIIVPKLHCKRGYPATFTLQLSFVESRVQLVKFPQRPIRKKIRLDSNWFLA